jgi:hypothetical protein
VDEITKLAVVVNSGCGIDDAMRTKASPILDHGRGKDDGSGTQRARAIYISEGVDNSGPFGGKKAIRYLSSDLVVSDANDNSIPRTGREACQVPDDRNTRHILSHLVGIVIVKSAYRVAGFPQRADDDFGVTTRSQNANGLNSHSMAPCVRSL